MAPFIAPLCRKRPRYGLPLVIAMLGLIASATAGSQKTTEPHAGSTAAPASRLVGGMPTGPTAFRPGKYLLQPKSARLPVYATPGGAVTGYLHSGTSEGLTEITLRVGESPCLACHVSYGLPPLHSAYSAGDLPLINGNLLQGFIAAYEASSQKRVGHGFTSGSFEKPWPTSEPTGGVPGQFTAYVSSVDPNWVQLQFTGVELLKDGNPIYVGDTNTASYLSVAPGVRYEVAPGYNVQTIGYDGSHRAIGMVTGFVPAASVLLWSVLSELKPAVVSDKINGAPAWRPTVGLLLLLVLSLAFAARAKGDIKVEHSHGVVINAGQKLNKTRTEVSVTRAPSEDSGVHLQEEVRRLKEMIQALPHTVAHEKAKQMADDATTLEQEANREQPRKEWCQLSLKGLTNAAKAVGEVGVPLAKTIQQIATTLDIHL